MFWSAGCLFDGWGAKFFNWKIFEYLVIKNLDPDSPISLDPDPDQPCIRIQKTWICFDTVFTEPYLDTGKPLEGNVNNTQKD
jgi:hypothetical protein